MTVLVDTTIWSLALRRRPTNLNLQETQLVAALTELVRSGDAALFGPIRQEVLSGIRRQQDFDRVRNHLAAFVELTIESADYERAAELFNTCRAHGVSATAIDMLICSVAIRLNVPVFTTDADFDEYSRHISLQLHRA